MDNDLSLIFVNANNTDDFHDAINSCEGLFATIDSDRILNSNASDLVLLIEENFGIVCAALVDIEQNEHCITMNIDFIETASDFYDCGYASKLLDRAFNEIAETSNTYNVDGYITIDGQTSEGHDYIVSSLKRLAEKHDLHYR